MSIESPHGHPGSMPRRRPIRRPIRRPRDLIAPFSLMLLGLLIRGLPYPELLGVRGGVVFFGNDAYYHLRRVAWTLANFPSTLRFDPFINYPQGAKPILAPLFDALIAWVAWPWTRALDDSAFATLERIAIWIPPVLGALTVGVVWWLAARHFSRGVAFIAALMLAISKAHFNYSRIGFIDHHVAVALLASLLLLIGLGLSAAHREDRRSAARLHALVGGLIVGIAFLIWPGCLLHVAILDLCLLTILVAERSAPRAGSLALELALLHAVALALVTPWSWGETWPVWGAFVPSALSNFQPWLLGSAVLSLGITAGVWRTRAGGVTYPRRVMSFGAINVLILCLSLALLPQIGDAAKLVENWLSGSGDFGLYGSISEAQPLFIANGSFDPERAIRGLSWFVFLVPPLIPLLAWSVRARSDRASAWMVLAWAAILYVVMSMQWRFQNSFSVVMALVFGVCVVHLWEAMTPNRSNRTRTVWAATIVGLSAVLLWPMVDSYAKFPRNFVAWKGGKPIGLSGQEIAQSIAVETGHWIRDHTPDPGGWLDPDTRPQYGILVPWNYGHLMKYAARRPVVADNFGEDVGGDGFAFANEAYLRPIEEVLPLLENRTIRYVVSSGTWFDLSRTPTRRSLLGQLTGRRPGAGLADDTYAEIRDVERLRLVYESRGTRDFPGASSAFRVFEIVPGARIVGVGPPRARIKLLLPIVTSRNRRIVFSATASVNEKGQYAFRVPYSNDMASDSLKIAPAYRLSLDDRLEEVVVPESAVQDGRDIPGPDFMSSIGEGAPK